VPDEYFNDETAGIRSAGALLEIVDILRLDRAD
jgi:hypothetical protein